MNSTIETYRIFSDFYDVYVGKFDSDFKLYKSFCSKSDKILEIGCGTGRILNLILQMNSNVTGIDISPEMLNKANKKFNKQIQQGELTLKNHDFTTNKLQDKFDLILLTFYTFNYIIDNPIEFMKNVNDSLNTNGLLLLDMFYPNSLYNKTINGKWIDKEFEIDGQFIKIRDRRTVDNGIEQRQQIFSINGKETQIDTKRRYYSPVNLKEILYSAGYTDLEFSYGYDYSDFNEMIDEKKLKKNYIVKARL